MKESIILIGGGGHCKSCIDVIEQEGKYRIAGIIDIKEKAGQTLLGYPFIGTDDDLPLLVGKYKNALITVGQIKSAVLRIKLYNYLKELNAFLPVILSPLAYLSKHALVEEGSIIMHHALINAEACIGANNIINSKVLIEHEAILGNHCHVSTSSKINGQVIIGDECFIGSGVTIANNIEIANKVIIPAGTTVFKSIKKSGIYIKS
ncbi:NeuD/PglB/VioB family sugar acetyltransferase [Albibacterium sp.]|uniref:NeuD/PglB/VioB family sugar acetyltransferase n=1 Tax=Albibacterium sp. TaxID=2952885 RepID=UPI002B6990BE|nr:NeuD/PglB/VioB family sugar acetyltransferase [Albibacterium sp.]HUH18007.1 NeuD/PglB/VioB family sugar acetyltransferase [Albibacterium sp.]